MRIAGIRFSKRLIVKLGLCAALLAGGFAFASLPQPVRIDSVSDLRTVAERDGLYVHGLASPDNFYVSDHVLSDDDLERIGFLKDCGRTPAWRGIVWIAQIRTPSSTMDLAQLDGNWRAWGNIVAVGDDRLISKIERSFR